MPSSVDGIGTGYCGEAAHVRWREPSGWFAPSPDHDAVLGVVFAHLLIVPIRAVHTFAWDGTSHRTVRLRLGRDLLARGYRMTADLLLVAFGTGFAAGAAVGLHGGATAAGLASAALSVATYGALVLYERSLRRAERRRRDVRLLLGPHALGSSDPGTWSPEVLEAARLPIVGDPLERARSALGRGDFARAMWSARVAAAMGLEGAERATDEILAVREVEELLSTLRKRPWEREGRLPGLGTPALLEASVGLRPGLGA